MTSGAFESLQALLILHHCQKWAEELAHRGKTQAELSQHGGGWVPQQPPAQAMPSAPMPGEITHREAELEAGCGRAKGHRGTGT